MSDHPRKTKRTHTAGGVVLDPAGRVLVVNQRGTSWSLPKGHVEPGEDFLTAARREIAEESGVDDLVYVRELGTYERHKIGKDLTDDYSELKIITIFLFRTAQTRLSPRDPHNPEAKWVDPSEVGGMLTHPRDSEFFGSILKEI